MCRAIALGRDEIYIEYIKKLKRRFTFMRAMQKDLLSEIFVCTACST